MIEMRLLLLGHGFSGVAPGSCFNEIGLSGPVFDCRVDAWQDPPVASLSYRKPELRQLPTKLPSSWKLAE